MIWEEKQNINAIKSQHRVIPSPWLLILYSASLLFCSAKVMASGEDDKQETQAGKSMSSSYLFASL